MLAALGRPRGSTCGAALVLGLVTLACGRVGFEQLPLRDLGPRDDLGPVDPGVPPPRALAPVAGSRRSAGRPTFRWQPAPEAEGVRLELCRAPACAQVEISLDLQGTTHTLAQPLAPGLWFWRLTSRRDGRRGERTSTPRVLAVGAGPAPGGSLAPVLDLDADGCADLAVASVGRSTEPGRVAIYRGSADGLKREPTWVLEGSRPTFGTAVAAVGDVDGDGLTDLAVGEPSSDPEAPGIVVVYLGGADGPAAEGDHRLEAPDDQPRFGETLAAALDVDRDGRGDLIVGAPPAGAAYLFLGRTDSAPVFGGRLEGAEAFGRALASLGDVDDDGFADVAVASGERDGAVHIHHGSPEGLERDARQVLEGGAETQGSFGAALASAGDLDGDGAADLAVAAEGFAAETGRVLLFRATPEGFERWPDLVLSGPDGPGGRFGSALAAGNVDGDPATDLLIGAAGALDGDGAVHLFRGAMPEGPMTRFGGPDGAAFGRSVQLRDIDRDGDEDAAAGAPGADLVRLYRAREDGLVTDGEVTGDDPGGLREFGRALD
ncbi:MAG: FG-GAP-like repeat-containing protein [Sandaracinaceae bacterium]